MKYGKRICTVLIVEQNLNLLILTELSPFSRLHSNNLNCDCHLSWLSQWLRQRPTLGLFTQCSSPPQLRGINVAEIQKHEFSCSGNSFFPSAVVQAHTVQTFRASSVYCPD